MAKNGYKINKSNYTVKRLHKSTVNGKVYERDFMTTNNLGGWDSGSIPNTENGFKMVYRNPYTPPRSHNIGNSWLTQPDGNTKWTLESNDFTEIGNESKIKLKPNYTSMLDFAYFGSCEELVKTSIKDIINRFPGELFGTNETLIYKYDSNGNSITLGNDGFTRVVENPFGIDLFTVNPNSEDLEKNGKLKYMSQSYPRYTLYTGDKVVSDTTIYFGCIQEYDITLNVEYCGINGDGSQPMNSLWDKQVDLTAAYIVCTGESVYSSTKTISIRRYHYGGKIYYLSNADFYFHIRPAKSEMDKFQSENDDFEMALLNPHSKPIYAAEFDFPHETERGVETYKKRFIWPLGRDGWNLEIFDERYASYLDELLNLAIFYDESYTDNLLRMLTHTSLKSLDVSYARNGNDAEQDEYGYGMTQMRGVLLAYGRQFDDIRGYIKNIKNSNNITYNQYGNLPDYFLTDVLNLSGWEVSSVVNSIKLIPELGVSSMINVETHTSTLEKGTNDYNLFPGESYDYKASDANSIFLRNLKINSKSILSRKGTKAGIEMILGLFGYRSDDFVNAYSATTGDNGDYSITEYVDVVSPKSGTTISNIEQFNSLRRDFYLNGETDSLIGLPVVELDYNDKRAIIPFFKAPEELDGKAYFQMYGGWEKLRIEYENPLPPTRENQDSYVETIKYLKVITKLSDLLSVDPETLRNGEIVYVYDISDFEKYIGDNESYKSNYFVIADKKKAYEFSESGWSPLEESNARIIELEKIVDEYRGNNPHIGYSLFDEKEYDDGKEFFNQIEQIFKGTIENDLFSDEAYDCDDNLIDGIEEQGFDVTEYKDNMKCWYFYDISREDTSKNVLKKLRINNRKTEYTERNMGYVEVGEGFKENRSGLYESELVPSTYVDNEFRIGSGMTNTLGASYSVLNSKRLTIEFHPNSDDEREYIKVAVLPYLEQMVPSTTILEIKI